MIFRKNSTLDADIGDSPANKLPPSNKPYLDSSEEQLLKLREAPIWEEMTAKLEEEAGLMLLGQSLVGMRWMINSKRPVASV